MAGMGASIEFKAQNLGGDDFADRSDQVSVRCEFAIRICGLSFCYGFVNSGNRLR